MYRSALAGIFSIYDSYRRLWMHGHNIGNHHGVERSGNTPHDLPVCFLVLNERTFCLGIVSLYGDNAKILSRHISQDLTVGL